MNELSILIDFGIALILGALVGVERERHFREEEKSVFAGMRTFALVCLSGAVCGYLTDSLGNGIAIAGLVVVGALSIASYMKSHSQQRRDIGATTELAFIFTFLVGVLLTKASRELGIAVGVTLAVLLSLKEQARGIIGRFGREDFYATLKFAMIAFVVLPFLPKTTFDPYRVLSAYKIWLMVVLVSGIGFSGYVATKFFGSRRGLGITAILGGMVSSTVTTMTFSNRSKLTGDHDETYALGILIACSTVFPRLLLEVYLVGHELVIPLLIPMGVMTILSAAICVMWYLRKSRQVKHDMEMTNPFTLSPAIKFAILFSIILVAGEAATTIYGSRGIYGAALLSGFVDVDAISLSVASLVSEGKLSVEVGSNAVVMAAVSNTVIKVFMTAIFGSWCLFKKVAPWFALILFAGLLSIAIF